MSESNKSRQTPYSRGTNHGKPFYQKGGGANMKQLPIPQKVQYYTDQAKKNLDSALLESRSAEWAKDFGEALKSSQLRRFYDDLKAIERKIMMGNQEENFERDRSLIALFKAKSVYAEKRKVSPPSFTQFIFDHVASINDLKDFKAFLKVFEAVVAYHKFFSSEK